MIQEPSASELTEILNQMGKHSEADMYNCGACGYVSCQQMALAIFNGKNKPQNCHHYVLKKANENHTEELNKKAREITLESVAMLEETRGNVSSLTQVTNRMIQNVSDSSASIEQMLKNISSINAKTPDIFRGKFCIIQNYSLILHQYNLPKNL